MQQKCALWMINTDFASKKNAHVPIPTKAFVSYRLHSLTKASLIAWLIKTIHRIVFISQCTLRSKTFFVLI